MKQRALYVLAFYAEKLRPDVALDIDNLNGASDFVLNSADATGERLQHRLIADAVVAASDEEAKQLGVERVLARFPEEEGWANHEVTVAIVTREFLLDAVEQSDDREGRQDESEIVM